MKVILLEKVKGMGNKHDVKDVPDGYASNFLFPKKLAEPATSQALARMEQFQNQIRVEKEIEHSLLKKYLADLESKELVLTEKANESGHLFSSIHAKEIASAMDKLHHIHIDPKYILLEKPIKAVGEYTIKVEAQKEKASFKLVIKSL